jgi:hypothetical protein
VRQRAQDLLAATGLPLCTPGYHDSCRPPNACRRCAACRAAAAGVEAQPQATQQQPQQQGHEDGSWAAEFAAELEGQGPAEQPPAAAMQIEQTETAPVAVSQSREEGASPLQSPCDGDDEARQGLLKASCVELSCCALLTARRVLHYCFPVKAASWLSIL